MLLADIYSIHSYYNIFFTKSKTWYSNSGSSLQLEMDAMMKTQEKLKSGNKEITKMMADMSEKKVSADTNTPSMSAAHSCGYTCLTV